MTQISAKPRSIMTLKQDILHASIIGHSVLCLKLFVNFMTRFTYQELDQCPFYNKNQKTEFSPINYCRIQLLFLLTVQMLVEDIKKKHEFSS